MFIALVVTHIVGLLYDKYWAYFIFYGAAVLFLSSIPIIIIVGMWHLNTEIQESTKNVNKTKSPSSGSTQSANLKRFTVFLKFLFVLICASILYLIDLLVGVASTGNDPFVLEQTNFYSVTIMSLGLAVGMWYSWIPIACRKKDHRTAGSGISMAAQTSRTNLDTGGTVNDLPPTTTSTIILEEKAEPQRLHLGQNDPFQTVIEVDEGSPIHDLQGGGGEEDEEDRSPLDNSAPNHQLPVTTTPQKSSNQTTERMINPMTSASSISSINPNHDNNNQSPRDSVDDDEIGVA